mmetsp:Transcript_3142/g.4968  ORF Transcript_3142/g.4968 Transcript_3142/m.4968 type:complete len:95 (-) Transcript_3142:180-464(-)
MSEKMREGSKARLGSNGNDGVNGEGRNGNSERGHDATKKRGGDDVAASRPFSPMQGVQILQESPIPLLGTRVLTNMDQIKIFNNYFTPPPVPPQ